METLLAYLLVFFAGMIAGVLVNERLNPSTQINNDIDIKMKKNTIYTHPCIYDRNRSCECTPLMCIDKQNNLPTYVPDHLKEKPKQGIFRRIFKRGKV